MTEKASPPSTADLIECLNLHYGLTLSTLTQLSLGADMKASIYKAQDQSKSTYFIKLKRGDCPDANAAILKALQHAGVHHLIPLLHTREGQTSQQLDGFTLSVSPFIEGENGFSRALTGDQWVTFGKIMRQIHDMSVPSELREHLRQETYSPRWRQTVRDLYPLINSQPHGDRVAIDFLELLKKQVAALHRLVDQAEHLANKATSESSPFVVCHSDLHAGNILIDKSNTFYIIDWDDPILAPKERDLMFIGGGVGNIWNKPHEVELFYEGYGEANVNPTLLAYFRHERILEDIASYSQEVLLTPKGGKDREKWYEEMRDQFNPGGVVDIAFNTAENLIL